MPFRRSSLDEPLLELLDQAGRNMERTAVLLHEMLSDFPERSELAREILICEHEGDRLTHDVIQRVNDRGAQQPVERSEIRALARTLDDIVDHAEETADRLGLYGIEATMEQAEQLAGVLARAATTVAAALSILRTGGDLASRLIEIHQLENEGDRLSRDAIASLFTGGIDPMVVIRWKDVFESLEQGIDACETVAHMLEGITQKTGR